MNKKVQTTAEIYPMTHLIPSEGSRRNIRLSRKALSLCLLVMTIALSACSSSASTPVATSAAPAPITPQPTAIPATSTPQPTEPPTQASTPASSTVLQQTTNTSLDPCQLISSQEASTLTGASFGSGEEGTIPGGMKTCTYRAQPSNTFIVDVIQAPSVDAANADKAQFLADLQAKAQQLSSEGLNVTQVPDFADGAVAASANISANGVTFDGSSFGFLKGTIFFGFSDIVIGGTAPSSAAMQAEASTVLGRLP